MFETRRPRTTFAIALEMVELIYHSTVREVRKSHRHALIGLLLNIVQTVIFVGAFYLLFVLLGIRPAGIKGDFLLFMMSGVFLFMVHIKALGAVFGSEGPAAPMRNHRPLNTVVTITSAALASLYLQMLSMTVVLFLYHAIFKPVTIDDPVGALGMILLSWSSGAGIGMVLLAAKPWNPSFVSLLSLIIMRANMVASGKMVVANSLGGTGFLMFGWNPLFHTIDQARGFVFLNYTPRFTSIEYPLYATLVLIMLGLLGEFFTRRRVSTSWTAKR